MRPASPPRARAPTLSTASRAPRLVAGFGVSKQEKVGEYDAEVYTIGNFRIKTFTRCALGGMVCFLCGI